MRRSSIVCCVIAACAVTGISFMPACGGNGSSTFSNGSSSGRFPPTPTAVSPTFTGGGSSSGGTTSGGDLPDGGFVCPSGLQCNVSCTGGGTTTITGKVYDPAGKNPLYNVAVYVPAVPLQPLPKGVPTGADACSCGALFESGALTTRRPRVDGTFTLHERPGRRQRPARPPGRQVAPAGQRSTSTACADNAQPDKSLTLPGTIAAGDTNDNMPDIAVSTGSADTLECLMLRIGLPASEYVAGAGHDGPRPRLLGRRHGRRRLAEVAAASGRPRRIRCPARPRAPRASGTARRS